jgi:hypothetical protein
MGAEEKRVAKAKVKDESNRRWSGLSTDVWQLLGPDEKAERIDSLKEAAKEEKRRVEEAAKEEKRRVKKAAKEEKRRVEEEAKEEERRVKETAKAEQKATKADEKNQRWSGLSTATWQALGPVEKAERIDSLEALAGSGGSHPGNQERRLVTALAKANVPAAVAAQTARNELRKGTQTVMKVQHQPSYRLKMTKGVREGIRNNTKRRKAVMTVLDSLANLMATGLTHEVAVTFDPKWEQDVAKLRVRAAQEMDVLEQDVLACKQHASWEKHSEQRKERAKRKRKRRL